MNKHSYDSERLLAIAAAKVHQQEADKLHRGITDGVEGLYAQIAKIICAIEKKGDIDTYTAQIISNAKLLTLSTKSQNYRQLTASEISHEINTAATCLASVLILTRINTQTETKVKTKIIKKARSEQGKNLVGVKHDQPGGTREKRQKIKTEWLSGQYGGKSECAEQLAKVYNLAKGTIQNQLSKYDDPDPWPAKKRSK